jgi:glycosyltransferase involved in cell wall biosynthesis
VVFTGQISSEGLRALYNCAEVFVYPSWYEGFGLPPLEAMACGAPVVLSQTSSLPEVGGDATLYIDPNDPESIAAGILQVLDDGELRQTLRQRGLARACQFSWHNTATRMIALYTQLAEQTLS